MSSNTRAKRAERHEKLLKRVGKFDARDAQSILLKDVAKEILLQHDPAEEHQKNDVEVQFQMLVPAARTLFTHEFFAAPAYSISLLKDVASFYACFEMTSQMIESIDWELRRDKVMLMFAWISAMVYEVDNEALTSILENIREVHGSPTESIATKRIPKPQEKAHESGPRLVLVNRMFSSRDGDSVQVGDDKPDSECSHQPQEFVQVTTNNNQEYQGSHVPHMDHVDTVKFLWAIHNAFKDKKFTGASLESIDIAIRDYNIVVDQLSLSPYFKAKFFINIFEDAAKTNFTNHCKMGMTFEKMEEVMRKQFDSDARQLQANMT